MNVHIVVAFSQNYVIGNKNMIPWRLRDDLRHLKQLTQDKIVILGSNTYQSMASYYDKSGREMPGRLYIVLTSSSDLPISRDNVTTAHFIDEAVQKAETLADEVYVIGGAHVYESMLPRAQTINATIINAAIDGDAYLPKTFLDDFTEVARETFPPDEHNEYGFSFVDYNRTT